MGVYEVAHRPLGETSDVGQHSLGERRKLPAVYEQRSLRTDNQGAVALHDAAVRVRRDERIDARGDRSEAVFLVDELLVTSLRRCRHQQQNADAEAAKCWA